MAFSAHAQKEYKDIRSGNKAYEDGKYTEAEIEYRKGLSKNSNSFESNFNIGNALYKQGKYKELPQLLHAVSSTVYCCASSHWVIKSSKTSSAVSFSASKRVSS